MSQLVLHAMQKVKITLPLVMQAMLKECLTKHPEMLHMLKAAAQQLQEYIATQQEKTRGQTVYVHTQ